MWHLEFLNIIYYNAQQATNNRQTVTTKAQHSLKCSAELKMSTVHMSIYLNVYSIVNSIVNTFSTKAIKTLNMYTFF